jgi:hypothetical protein
MGELDDVVPETKDWTWVLEIVSAELVDAQRRLSASFAGVTGSQWQRTGNRSDNKRFTVESFARYMLHDPVHHVWDVTHMRAD